MVAFPSFIEEEIVDFDGILARVVERNQPVFLANCRNLGSDPENAELFAAAYLLMNVMLMERVNGQITKLICIRGDEKFLPILNTLRSLFHSEFSSLDMVDTWKSIIGRKIEIAAPSLNRIESAINFVQNSGIIGESDYFRKADVVFGRYANGADAAEAPFTVSDEQTFVTRIASRGHVADILTSEIFVADAGIVVKINRPSHSVLVDVDFDDADWLSAWMGNVESIVSSKMYAGK